MYDSALDSTVDALRELGDTAAQLTKSLEVTLIRMNLNAPAYPDVRTPGWFAKHQVRCGGCGRFAPVEAAGSSYDDWWIRVECSRCGSQDGIIGKP